MPGYAKFDFYLDIDKLKPKENKHLKMLEYAFMERIRCKKITVLLLTGDTSEGKSSISQKLVEEFCSLEKIDYSKHVDDVTIYTPLEYPEKTKKLLFDKELKPLKFLIIDEGRLVVRAKNWHSFINQVIADIFAMQRRIKRLFVIINTQSLDDIDKDLRRRLTFWGIVYRPLHKKPKLYLYRFWDDTRDPSSIKLKKRTFRGLIMENKKIRISQPPFIKFGLPSQKVWKTYDENAYKAKAGILKGKLDALMEKMQSEYGEANTRIEHLLKHYTDNPARINELVELHGKVRNNKFKLRKDAVKLFQLTDVHAKQFNEKVTSFLNNRIKSEEGVFGDGVQKKE